MGERKEDEDDESGGWQMANFLTTSEPRSTVTSRRPGIDRQGSERPGRVYRERVLVRVYDLGQTFITKGVLNRVTQNYGAFHTGVEVYGREWSFGMTLDDWSTGVTWNPPGINPDHSFRETLSMGYTTLSPMQVLKLIDVMKVEWKGSSYNLLARNCHHFSDEFCQRLGVVGLPDWVNTLAKTGHGVADFLDSADSGYDGGEALADFFRGVGGRLYESLAFTDPSARPAKSRKELDAKSTTEEASGETGDHDPFATLRRSGTR